MCDINVQTGVVFEEEVIQKIVRRLIQSCKKTSSSNAVDLYLMCTGKGKNFTLEQAMKA
jgi:hypothetical protein